MSPLFTIKVTSFVVNVAHIKNAFLLILSFNVSNYGPFGTK